MAPKAGVLTVPNEGVDAAEKVEVDDPKVGVEAVLPKPNAGLDDGAPKPGVLEGPPNENDIRLLVLSICLLRLFNQDRCKKYRSITSQPVRWVSFLFYFILHPLENPKISHIYISCLL